MAVAKRPRRQDAAVYGAWTQGYGLDRPIFEGYGGMSDVDTTNKCVLK